MKPLPAIYRLMLAAVLILTAVPAAIAQTAISNETANAYYKRCMSVDDARMNDESQDSLCSCASVKLMSVMTAEDLAVMTPTPGPGRTIYDRMLADAYAPCMQAPVEEQLYAECMNDTKIRQFALRDQSALCRCTSQKSTEMIPVEAPKIVRQTLKTRPDLQDAFDVIHRNDVFRAQAYDNLSSCLHAGN